MLKLKNIKKVYIAGNQKVEALKGIDVEFRSEEFVAILGASGCGKTTLLNIIGGLDHYSDGDLLINDISTKSYNDKNWDAYRNNCIGFVFQSYNLIPHINVIANVEMSMTLSGMHKSKRRQKAMEALTRVGLEDQAFKKPNQLSGGQMQRVAIARALVNDPQVILADEPTGALDSVTSVQIMDLIREIAKDKLVIMVTHNPEIAETYANRIIEVKDGLLISDSRPVKTSEGKSSEITIKKTAMNYINALALSFHNIKTKKGRTLLTAFASSIGIIGIALILALSNGFQVEIDRFERDSLSQAPIMVMHSAMPMDAEAMQDLMSEEKKLETRTNKKEVAPLKDMSSMLHTNLITQDYIDYVENIDSNLLGGLSYERGVMINGLVKNASGETQMLGKASAASWNPVPIATNEGGTIIDNYYDVIAGRADPTSLNLVLFLSPNNEVSETVLNDLGFDTSKNVSFEEIMNKEIVIVANDDYYQNRQAIFIPNQDLENVYNNSKQIKVKIGAIVRGKEGQDLLTSQSGIGMNDVLVQKIIEMNESSEVVKAQENVGYNILSGSPFDTDPKSTNSKTTILGMLGKGGVPTSISIYPKDFDSKDSVIAKLDAYNDGKEKDQKILYMDQAAIISSLSGNIMASITIVLIAFSAISLIVSSIMIGIITYISVLERTKEIGVLRALGARKRDISRVFNAETLIVGLTSGLLGIGIAQLLTYPANAIIESISGLANVAKLNPLHALILIVISMILTLIGGFIPSKIASKKDPVTALRSE